MLKQVKTAKNLVQTTKKFNTATPAYSFDNTKQYGEAGKKTVMCINRGEIATRVFRAAKEQGFNSLGVYSDVDNISLHRFKSDKSVLLDTEKSAVAQYLDIDHIVKLAKEHGADIIHPGYGFLSENPLFAAALEKAGLTLAGPSSEVIEFFGDKIKSKAFAKSQGVPVPEGSAGPVPTIEEAIKFSNQITYPVMVKATAGGGGRGIRIARNDEELRESYERCQSEAKSAFGNDEVFIEKFVEEPRHIEVQILADNYGNVVHLYERDCSVQRRNQKVVEIAPCASLDEAARQAMCADAVKLCKAAKYRNAGTVEFLVDKNNKHFFIECNTRIQVEHTVTEEITGMDIVGAQLQIASGKSLEEIGFTQDKISTKGFAIQLRLTTEDVANDFSPDTGRIAQYQPGGGHGIRIDGNAYSGIEITPSYDSLLCKITGRARTFEEAAARLVREIQETKVSGVKTNQGFLQNVLQHPKFLSGQFTTSFIADHPELFKFKPKRDEQQHVLKWMGEFYVNKTAKLQGATGLTQASSPKPPVLPENIKKQPLTGYRDILLKDGPKGLADAVLKEKKVLLTDTTMRDAHQSLLMTRMRTRDILQIAESTAHSHKDFFSLENWGGATFDVALRFLHECPWQRLERMRELIPNIPFQMLLRGANAVGYTSYADNVVHKFCQQSVKSGMDVFRVFDSLNYFENMKLGIDAVGQAGGVVEGTICYTGIRDKYTLEYYVEYARKIVEYGTHFLALKDMTGLLKPAEAKLLISTLKKEFPNTPIHVHMHDNAGSSIASLYACVEAGADIIDLCTDAMSGVTSQGSYGTMTNILRGHERDPKIDASLDLGYNQYWRQVREVYSPFESPERSSFSDTYQHEMPGGQYTNLQFQAKSMGLQNEWERVKQCYIDANQVLGDIIKVTPSSKTVGDLAQFMVTNNLDLEGVRAQAKTLDFPKSVLEYLQGYLGQPFGGFPEPFRTDVLNAQGLKPLEGRPGDSIPSVDFDAVKADLEERHGQQMYITDSDVISAVLYPDVFEDYATFLKTYGDLSDVPTEYLLRPVNANERVDIELKDKKPFNFQLLGTGPTNTDTGLQEVIFRVNGVIREIKVKDNSVQSSVKENEKASASNPGHIGAPIKSSIVDVKVKEGEEVEQGQVVAVLTAMKMEMTVKSNVSGVVKRVVQQKGADLEGGDLIVELEV